MIRRCNVTDMNISTDDFSGELDEAEIYKNRLPLIGSSILDLGCGSAQHSAAIADLDSTIRLTALEVDKVQHAKNLRSIKKPNIIFKLAGAEQIPEPDASFDIVMLFKSLHHVPLDFLGQALTEIHRVLKPNGLVYISEPIFAGAFNEILRLFHDEQGVRHAAFEAVREAVADGYFALVEQIFFHAATHFTDFADFESKIIEATHSEHCLSSAVLAEVKVRMESHKGADGIRFSSPMRVDLLRKV